MNRLRVVFLQVICTFYQFRIFPFIFPNKEVICSEENLANMN